MSRRSRFVVLVFFAVAVGAAAWFWYQPVDRDLTVRPTAKAATLELDAPVSVLGVRLRLQAKALEALANAEVPTAFEIPSETHRKKIKAVGIKVGSVSVSSRGRIERGTISIAAADDAIKATVPVAASMTLYKGDLTETAKGAADFNALLTLGVGTDWRLVSKAAISYEWTKRPSATLLGIRVSLGSHASAALDPKLRDIEREVAEELPRRVAFKPAVETAWQRLFEPLPLNDRGDLWLVAEPRRVYLPPPATVDGAYVVAPAIEATMRIVHGARPEPKPATPLPLLTTSAPPAPGIAIEVPIDARYDTLRATLRAALSKPLLLDVAGAGQVRVRVDDVVVYASAPRLVVGAKVSLDTPGAWFNTRGWIYLAGTPNYDAASARLTIPDLDYSRDTDNAAFQVLSAAFRGVLRDALRRAADVDVSREVAALRADAQRRIQALPEIVLGNADATARRLLGSRLRADGAITNIAIGALTPGEASVQLTARVEGRVDLELVPEAGNTTGVQ